MTESAELKLFFSGDSGYYDFCRNRRRYGPFDLTMLETGAYNEHWPCVHMAPAADPPGSPGSWRALAAADPQRHLRPGHASLVRAVRTDTELATEHGRAGFHADDGRADRPASTACRPTLVARSGSTAKRRCRVTAVAEARSASDRTRAPDGSRHGVASKCVMLPQVL